MTKPQLVITIDGEQVQVNFTGLKQLEALGLLELGKNILMNMGRAEEAKQQNVEQRLEQELKRGEKIGTRDEAIAFYTERLEAIKNCANPNAPFIIR